MLLCRLLLFMGLPASGFWPRHRQNHGKNLVHRVLLCIILSTVFRGFAAPSDKSVHSTGKSVLVLHSYYKGFRWTDDEGRGIDSVLLPEIGASNLYIEYMDTKRFFDPGFIAQFPEIYRRKFLMHHFDVVIATDNNAFDFLRRYRDELFPNTPVVFCGVNYFKEDDLKGHPLFTGVSEEADVKDTLDLALRLHPGTQHIYVVNEVTETGQTVHDEVVKLIPLYRERAPITFLEDYSMPDLLGKLRTLPARSLVFYSFFSRDQTGRFFEYDESARAIARASNAPIYGAWDFNLGYGIVGGKLISGFYQGETAGRMALRILHGENPDSIPVVRFSADRPNRYMFDYNELQRLGIPLRALPKDRYIANMPESFFRRHAAGTIVGSGLFLFLIAANSLLMLNVRRRKEAERALLNQQEHLEELVASRSAQLEQLNSRLLQDISNRESTERALRDSQQMLNKTFSSLRDCLLIIASETRTILDCNPATTALFGFTRDEVLGQSVRMLHVDEQAFERFGNEAHDAIREKGYLLISAFKMRRKNGEVFPTQHSVLPIYDDSGVMVSWVSVIRDIMEETRSNEQLAEYQRKLRKLAAELTVVEARERRAIASELHENLGQVLATAKLKVAPLRALVPEPQLKARVEEVQSLVEDALQQTRSLTYQLSSPILYQLGLEAALQWQAENVQRQYGYHVTFTRLGESGLLREESSVFLFSAVRELLVNIAKHAHATEAVVRLRWREEAVEVLVQDNGKGFKRESLSYSSQSTHHSNDGFGLFNIYERASDLGGRVLLRSEPLKGTAVKIHLPLDSSAANKEVEHEHQDSLGG